MAKDDPQGSVRVDGGNLAPLLFRSQMVINGEGENVSEHLNYSWYPAPLLIMLVLLLFPLLLTLLFS